MSILRHGRTIDHETVSRMRVPNRGEDTSRTMSARVDMHSLLHVLLQHGWDYTKLPPTLRHVPRRTLQRAWQKRSLATYATSTDHVALAMLEVDPPSTAKRLRRCNPSVTSRPVGQSMEMD